MIFAALFQGALNLPADAPALENSISVLQNAISVLEGEIKTLENSSVPWEHSVWVFTFFVAIGVALELWVIRHEWLDEGESWALAYFWAVRPPGRPSIGKLMVEIGSVLLITIGIVGELGVGIKIGSINATLRSKNAELRSESDQLLAVVTQQAGDAAASAKIAHDEASAVKDIADAAKKEAESERLARVQLQKELQPRRLTSAQIEKLTSLLRNQPKPIFILTMGDDTETADLSNDIGEALNKAE